MDNPPLNLETTLQGLLAWHQRWKEHFVAGQPIADYMLKPEYHDLIASLPDIVKLVVELLTDPHLAPEIKAELASAGDYLVNTNDLISEDKIGASGFLDDAVILITPLHKLAQHQLEFLTKHWDGNGSIFDLLETYYPQRDAIFAYAKKIAGLETPPDEGEASDGG